LRATSEAYFATVARGAPVARRFIGAPATGTPESVAASGRSDAARNRRATGVLLLIDSRHPGLESDVVAAGWLGQLGTPWHVVATKIDKLSRAERARNLRELERTFGMAALPVSAESGEGLDELWQMIANLVRR
jgi:predicted GTPase